MATLEDIEKQLAQIRKQAGMVGEGVTTLAEQKGNQSVAQSARQITQDIQADELNDNVPELPEVNFNDVNLDAENATKNLSSAGTTAVNTMDFWQTQMANINKQLADAQKAQQDALTKLTDQKADFQQMQKDLMAEYGIPDKMEQLQEQAIKVAGLKGEQAKLEVQQQQEIDRTYQQPVVEFSINSQLGEINRKYGSQQAYLSIQIGQEALLMSAYQGNLDQAKSIVNDLVNAATFDLQWERQKYEYVYNYYGDFVNTLTTQQQNTLSMAYNEAVRQEESAKTDERAKYELQIQAAENGVNLGNISGMSLEDVVKLYNQRVAPVIQARKDRENMGQWGLSTQKEQKYWNEIDASRGDLMQGIPWGTVWDRVKGEFPEVPNSVIDQHLGTEWRQGGAFEQFQQTGQFPTIQGPGGTTIQAPETQFEITPDGTLKPIGGTKTNIPSDLGQFGELEVGGGIGFESFYDDIFGSPATVDNQGNLIFK